MANRVFLWRFASLYATKTASWSRLTSAAKSSSAARSNHVFSRPCGVFHGKLRLFIWKIASLYLETCVLLWLLASFYDNLPSLMRRERPHGHVRREWREPVWRGVAPKSRLSWELLLKRLLFERLPMVTSDVLGELFVKCKVKTRPFVENRVLLW